MNDILQVYIQFPDIRELVKEGEKVLQGHSRPPSVCESVSIPIPDSDIPAAPLEAAAAEPVTAKTPSC